MEGLCCPHQGLRSVFMGLVWRAGSDPGAVTPRASSHRGESPPKSSARHQGKENLTSLVLLSVQHPQQQLSMRLLHGVFPVSIQLLIPVPIFLPGGYFPHPTQDLSCRSLAGPRCLFPGREHGWQHLRQLRQRQSRALCKM